MIIRTLLALTLQTAIAAAQDQQAKQAAPNPDQLRADLATFRRDLSLRQSDIERLLELRIRHDFGLPIDSDAEVFSAPFAPVVTNGKPVERQLAEADATVSVLQSRFDTMQQQVDRMKAANLARGQKQTHGDEWITLPVAGASSAQGAELAAPVGEHGLAAKTVGEPLQVHVVANLGPIRGQIDGSKDHMQIAAALFRAGQVLAEHAENLRQQGQGAAAQPCDDAAKERLQRAVTELEETTSQQNPPFPELFYLGKCRELLFRIAERRDGLSLRNDTREFQRREQEVRDPFIAITARDVETVDGREQPGAFGRAAQTALEHFRWMNLHRGFAPKIPLDSITWPTQNLK
ncbi:MAG: hypothetical protein NT107_10935 [Planctomycetota bacterium]|nr:hypothetical protein [Planctomycetota bacterium]